MSEGAGFESTETDGIRVVRVLRPRFRVDEAEALLAAVAPDDPVDGPPPRLVLDLGTVEFLDSGALSVIWRINERTTLRLAGLTALVISTFRILGMLNVLAHDNTVEESVAALREQAR